NIEKGQCFPLYLYPKPTTAAANDLFAAAPERSDAITDAALAHFCNYYTVTTISKEDIFYYVYGLLHSPDYRHRYAANLSKQLPRIPCVATYTDFQHFSRAGRALAELHINYDQQAMYSATITIQSSAPSDPKQLYYVTKMKYAKTGKTKDLTSIIYNKYITISNIPERSYDYIVSGRPAIDWVVERQGVRTDKASGIINDANQWSTNPKYPLELLLRVITVSLETLRIVEGLPELEV
ncbi:hypothetical protein TI04_12240, partial [Achromatium sp. WMS2]